MTRTESLAWAAGFFDGEGCFTTTRGNATKTGVKRSYMKASVAQKYDPLLVKFREIVGVGSICFCHARPPYYMWTCNGRAVDAVAELLWPWLGDRKKDQLLAVKDKVNEARLIADASRTQEAI